MRSTKLMCNASVVTIMFSRCALVENLLGTPLCVNENAERAEHTSRAEKGDATDKKRVFQLCCGCELSGSSAVS